MAEAEQRLQEMRTAVPEQAPGPRRVVPAAPATPQPSQPRPIQVGDTVHVRSIGLTGEVLAIDEEDQTAEVQVGGFRMQADLRELRREKGERQRQDARRATPARSSLPPVPDVSMSFDIRGWRAAEVAEKLDRYLNDAYLAGMPSVQIIHGKGTGALRQVVRDVVSGHPLVASFGGGGQEGGDGVTVVRLVER
jgi:DNA mismatch repair protein MutS2